MNKKAQNIRILGIESSCDETAVAIYDSENGIIAHKIQSQIALHRQHGGVVPELASREHIANIQEFVSATIKDAQIGKDTITAIAYTAGPGLMGPLLIGSCFAKSLALSWKIPTIKVNHLEAHIMAVFLEKDPPSFPFISLLVSGGHTQLIKTTALGEHKLLGETLDDAAGEAFDKTAKLLNLGYPGGPAISKLAKTGNHARFEFPRPMSGKPGLDFSFSGLKTHTATCLKQNGHNAQDIADIAAGFEMAVVDSLIIKIKRAIKQEKIKNLVIAGGVAANQLLRTKINILSKELKLNVIFPQPQYCTDNGAMVAVTGYLKLLASQNNLTTNLKIQTHPRWPLG